MRISLFIATLLASTALQAAYADDAASPAADINTPAFKTTAPLPGGNSPAAAAAAEAVGAPVSAGAPVTPNVPTPTAPLAPDASAAPVAPGMVVPGTVAPANPAMALQPVPDNAPEQPGMLVTRPLPKAMTNALKPPEGEPPVDPVKLREVKEKLTAHARDIYLLDMKIPPTPAMMETKKVHQQMVMDCAFIIINMNTKRLKFADAQKEEAKLAAMLADGKLDDKEIGEWHKDMGKLGQGPNYAATVAPTKSK